MRTRKTGAVVFMAVAEDDVMLVLSVAWCRSWCCVPLFKAEHSGACLSVPMLLSPGP